MNIGALVGFLTTLTSGREIFNYIPAEISERLNIASLDDRQILITFSIVFGFCLVLSNVLRLLLVWATTKITLNLGAELSVDAFRRSLYQPYSTHISRSTSEVINGITNTISATVSSISSVFGILGNLVMIFSIILTIFFINPQVALTSILGFLVIYSSITFFTRKNINKYSVVIAEQSNISMKVLQESLNGIRDVLLDGSQESHVSVYRGSEIRSRASQARILFIGTCPRYGVESLGMVLILILACQMSFDSNGTNSVIPVLGALALGAQRLLPVVQQAYASWIGIKGNKALIELGLNLLRQPIPTLQQSNQKDLKFNDSIDIRTLSYKYSDNREYIFKDLSLSIKKGLKVGFIGITGSGKSTLLDLIMGLLTPQSGHIEIDGVPLMEANIRSWQNKIAHVPQSIFLSDTTVLKNIAFGVSEEIIDMNKVIESAKIAQIHDVIESWPDGYLTNIGERGVRLSGGQKQRLGIARALYKNSEVLVLDEATSALDMATEEKVMKGIYKFSSDQQRNITVLMIAHRRETLMHCDYLVNIKPGGYLEFGSYKEIMEKRDV